MLRYKNLYDVQVIVKFIVTGITEAEWDTGEISFSNSDYSFYNADIERDAEDFTEAEIAIFGQFCLVGSNVDMVEEAFAEYGNTVETDIYMDGRELKIIREELYHVTQEEY